MRTGFHHFIGTLWSNTHTVGAILTDPFQENDITIDSTSVCASAHDGDNPRQQTDKSQHKLYCTFRISNRN